MLEDVTKPKLEVLEDVVVKFNLLDVTTSSRSLIVVDDGCVLVAYVDSVIGLLLSVEACVEGCVEAADVCVVIGRRVTNVDLTVEVLNGAVVVASSGLALVELELVLSSADTTEKVVVNAESSSASVVDSTLTIAPVGFGLGRGVFVVCTNEMVVNCGSAVDGFAAVVDGFRFGVSVEFLREIVVRRFTAIVVLATGFLVVFITVVVAFFEGLLVVAGRLVGRTDVSGDSVETDGRLGTGFLGTTVGLTFWTVIDALDNVSLRLIDSPIDWNVVNFMLSVVLAGRSSFNLIVVDVFRSTMLPNVVEKPPALTEYFSVVGVVLRVTGRRVDANVELLSVVVINSKVLLL